MNISRFFLLFLITLLPATGADSYYYQKGKKIYLSPIQKQTAQAEVQIAGSLTRSTTTESDNLLYYTDNDGRELGVTNRIILKLKEGVDADALFNAYHLSLHKDLKNGLYSVTTQSVDEVVDLANTLYELTDVEYAHPDFYIPIKRR